MYRKHGRPTAQKSQRLMVFMAILAGLLALPGVAQADEIAFWNFSDSNLLVDRGAGTLTTTANPANVIFSTNLTAGAQIPGDLVGFSLAIQGGVNNANNGSILDLHVSTVGFNNILVNAAMQRTATGFDSVEVQGSTNGVTFFHITTFAPVLEPVNAGFGVVFGTGSAVENNPLFTLRYIVNGATSETGLIRFDNILVAGTATAVAVPEPSTLLLLGTGLFGAVGTARRWSRKNS